MHPRWARSRLLERRSRAKSRAPRCAPTTPSVGTPSVEGIFFVNFVVQRPFLVQSIKNPKNYLTPDDYLE